ncbi:MAG: cupin domain-containing protein [Terrimonas sp.]|nr:cupin domain-containing protein [Terrimonas sp.]
MNPISLSSIPEIERIPGYFGRFIHSRNMTMAFWEVKAGSPIPEHRHVQEQIMTVTDGLFELVVEGQRHMMKAGDVCIIPSNVLHGGKAISNCRIVDVFNPVREDYVEKDYSYISNN